MTAAKVVIATLALGIATVAATLATISGAISAVEWAIHTFGGIPVALTGMFFAGAATMHAIDRAAAVQQREHRLRRHKDE